jgi:hypothetical protein
MTLYRKKCGKNEEATMNGLTTKIHVWIHQHTSEYQARTGRQGEKAKDISEDQGRHRCKLGTKEEQSRNGCDERKEE